jgi:hypothetical protein
MTFSEKQQTAHRKTFIEECRQKAWGARCHAEWISKSLDEVMAHYTKLKEEDRALEASIKDAETAVDYHIVENRNKRKAMQERRNVIAQQMKVLGENLKTGQQAFQQLHSSAETNLALAAHAETWGWKEVEAAAPASAPGSQDDIG